MKKNGCIVELLIFLFLIVGAATFILSLVFNNAYGVAASLPLIFVALIMCIIKSLTSKEKNRWYDWAEIVISFFGIIIIVIVFSSASPSSIKEAVIQISAASLGGLLTLYGVGITIKYGRIEKEEDEIKRLKPHIFPISDLSWNSIPKDQRNFIDLPLRKTDSGLFDENNGKHYCIESITIANSDLSMCSLYGIIINDKELLKFDYESVLFKNSYTMVTTKYDFYLEPKLKSISLLVEDILHNLYKIEVRFESFCHENDITYIKFLSFLDIGKVEK